MWIKCENGLPYRFAVAQRYYVKKVKVKWIYIAPSRETFEALRHGSQLQLHNYTNACLYFVSIHQTAPPQTEVADI